MLTLQMRGLLLIVPFRANFFSTLSFENPSSIYATLYQDSMHFAKGDTLNVLQILNIRQTIAYKRTKRFVVLIYN